MKLILRAIQGRFSPLIAVLLLGSFTFLVAHSATHADSDHSCIICHADVHVSQAVDVCMTDVTPTGIETRLIIYNPEVKAFFVYSADSDRAPPVFS